MARERMPGLRVSFLRQCPPSSRTFVLMASSILAVSSITVLCGKAAVASHRFQACASSDFRPDKNRRYHSVFREIFVRGNGGPRN